MSADPGVGLSLQPRMEDQCEDLGLTNMPEIPDLGILDDPNLLQGPPCRLVGPTNGIPLLLRLKDEVALLRGSASYMGAERLKMAAAALLLALESCQGAAKVSAKKLFQWWLHRL